jgi:hypothetical protein
VKAMPTYLSAGHIGAFIKLFPVVSWLVKERRELAVIRQMPTHDTKYAYIMAHYAKDNKA